MACGGKVRRALDGGKFEESVAEGSAAVDGEERAHTNEEIGRETRGIGMLAAGAGSGIAQRGELTHQVHESGILAVAERRTGRRE